MLRSPGSGPSAGRGYDRAGLKSVFREEALKAIRDDNGSNGPTLASAVRKSSLDTYPAGAGSTQLARPMKKAGRDVFRPEGAWWVGGLRRKSSTLTPVGMADERITIIALT